MRIRELFEKGLRSKTVNIREKIAKFYIYIYIYILYYIRNNPHVLGEIYVYSFT